MISEARQSLSSHVEPYFHCRSHAGFSQVDKQWVMVERGHVATGEQLRWAVLLDGGVIQKARYQVQGSVLLTAACAKAAQWIEGMSLSLAAAELQQQLTQYFSIAPKQAHVPHLIAQALCQIQQKLNDSQENMV
jgi:NifU-like protein involved in Fe-S cluster formation